MAGKEQAVHLWGDWGAQRGQRCTPGYLAMSGDICGGPAGELLAWMGGGQSCCSAPCREWTVPASAGRFRTKVIATLSSPRSRDQALMTEGLTFTFTLHHLDSSTAFSFPAPPIRPGMKFL